MNVPTIGWAARHQNQNSCNIISNVPINHSKWINKTVINHRIDEMVFFYNNSRLNEEKNSISKFEWSISPLLYNISFFLFFYFQTIDASMLKKVNNLIIHVNASNSKNHFFFEFGSNNGKTLRLEHNSGTNSWRTRYYLVWVLTKFEMRNLANA